MPIQGFVKSRAHQFGRQAVFGTKVAATRRYPHAGVPSVGDGLGWTNPEVDIGLRDPSAPPYRGPAELTATITNPSLSYNNLAKIFAGFFGGEVVPSGAGTAKTWLWEPTSATVEDPDPFTYEFGDDVTTDWFQYGDCIVESFELTAENKGPVASSETWRIGSIASTGSTDSPVTGTVPTPGLSVATDDALLYLKDMGIYIASDPDDLFLAPAKIVDALHGFTLRGSQEMDLKRFANQTQNFDVDAYGPGARVLELENVFAKTADTVGTGSESDAWHSDTAVDRFVGLRFVSTVLAQAPATFHGLDITLPLRYYTREEGEIGGNTTLTLLGRAFYDPTDLEGVFVATLVNTLSEAELGVVGS